jgi:hypothetical protein
MRKRWISTLAIGAALSVFLAGGAAAYKPTIIKESNLPMFLNGSFNPTKLPKKKLAPVHLTLIGSELPVGPVALKEAIFEIDKNVAFNAKGLAVCRPGLPELAIALDPCKKARVGKGEMEFEIELPETPPFTEKSHVVAYNGERRAGVRTILVLGYLPNPILATVVIRIEVTKIDHGRYGTKLVATIPSIAGGSASMKEFRFELFRRFTYRGKRRSYLLARCTDGKLQAHWEAVFTDGTDAPGGFKRPCTPQP